MQKIKELLIRNVQWLTMVLGLAFLGYMAYRYFVQVDLKTKVDSETAEQPLQTLQGAVNSTAKPNIVVPTYVGQLTAALAGPATRPTNGRWTTAVPLDPEIPAIGGGSAPAPNATPKEGSGPGVTANGKGQVTATPTLEAPTVLGTSFGESSAYPGTFSAPGQTGSPPAGVAAIDKTWLSSGYAISIATMGKDFAAAGVPAGLTTMFLRCEMERVEVMPDGSTGNSTLVKPLVGSQLSQHPMPPGYDAAYLQWAEPNQVEILQSPFYLTGGGSTWVVPGQKRAPTAPFDPSKYATGPIPDWLSPEQRKLVVDYRNEQKKKKDEKDREERRNRNPPPGGGGPRGGSGAGGIGGGGGGFGPAGGGGFVPAPPSGLVSDFGWASPSGDNPIVALVNFIAPPPPPDVGPMRPPGGGGNFTPPEDNGVMPGGAQPGPSATQAVGPVPGSAFDPAAWAKATAPTVTAFAHDETVEPGKTYRYRMRYFVLNPIYGQPNAAAKADLAKVYRWESKWSEWTPAFTVPQAISFFVVSRIADKATTVQFEVFHFSKGQLRNRNFTVGIGDFIGATEGDSDLSTGYTLVDVRKDAKGTYALVMGPDGSVTRHDAQDTQSERYRDLKNQTLAPAVGAAGGQ